MNYELKSEIKQRVNAELIKECKFLQNFSELFLIDLVQKFNEQTLQPNDYIFKVFHIIPYTKSLTTLMNAVYILFREAKLSCFMVAFIKLETNQRSLIKQINQFSLILKKNNYFGEVSFFTGMAHEINAYCLDFTIITFITREDFIILLKQYPLDFVIKAFLQCYQEIFCEIKDKIMLYNNYKNIYRVCLGCGKYDHLETDCPLLHLKVNKLTIISKFNYYDPQRRVKEKRRSHKFPNSRFTSTSVFQSALVYIMKNNDENLVEDVMTYLNEINGEEFDKIIQEENVEDENSKYGKITKELKKYNSQFFRNRKQNYSQQSTNQLTINDFYKMNKNESKVILSTIIRQQKRNITENVQKQNRSRIYQKSDKHGTLPIKFNQTKINSIIQNKKEAITQDLNFFDDINEQNEEQAEHNSHQLIAEIHSEKNIYKNTFIYHTPQKVCGPCDCVYINTPNRQQIQIYPQDDNPEICMESKQSYQKYFPHNNIEIILKKFKQQHFQQILNDIRNTKLTV